MSVEHIRKMLHYLSAKKLFPKDFISIIMYRLAKATTILAYRTTVWPKVIFCGSRVLTSLNLDE